MGILPENTQKSQRRRKMAKNLKKSLQSVEECGMLYGLQKGGPLPYLSFRDRKTVRTPIKQEEITMDLIKELNKEALSKEMPKVQIGDTVRVHVKVKEGSRERIQVFEGVVIAKKHGGIEETITVRRISYGVGVEKVFPLHSPSIDTIQVVRNGAVRRAKLYYLRGRVGKSAKIKEKL